MLMRYAQSFLTRICPSLRSRSGGGISDADLLERFIQDKDEAAFELIVWRHGPLVLGTCRRVLRDEQDAEDAFQATFFALARKATTIGSGQSLSAWLFKVAYRIALRARSLQARRQREGELVEEPVAAASPEPADLLAGKELGPVLDKQINRLPEKYRNVFILCVLEGKTNEEAAQELGCPRGTVLSRLARARERLRKWLGDRGALLTLTPFTLPGLPRLLEVSPVLVNATVHLAILVPLARWSLSLAESTIVQLAEDVLRDLRRAAQKRWAAVLALILLFAGSMTASAAWVRSLEPPSPNPNSSSSSQSTPSGCHSP
jgi:RNA polymerase sigma factor (sigma-70 family)